jgi:hypothetical protein
LVKTPRYYISEKWVDQGPASGGVSYQRQSGQVKRSASGRHDGLEPDLLQRYGVSLGVLEEEGRRCDEEHQ